jgi:hypothetical protein
VTRSIRSPGLLDAVGFMKYADLFWKRSTCGPIGYMIVSNNFRSGSYDSGLYNSFWVLSEFCYQESRSLRFTPGDSMARRKPVAALLEMQPRLTRLVI